VGGRPLGLLSVADSRIDDLRRRLERDPGSRLFAQLAEEYRKAGDRAEAIRVARAGLALHPAYPSARLTLGRALLDSGDAAGARAELEAALRDAPDNILASRFLGQALEAVGELGPALQQLEKTLKMAPGDRQLETQIVALRSRVGTPPARATAPATAPGGRPAAAPARSAESAPPELPPTIPIYRPGDREARTTPPATRAAPPLPPSAPPAPRPVSAPPPAAYSGETPVTLVPEAPAPPVAPAGAVGSEAGAPPTEEARPASAAARPAWLVDEQEATSPPPPATRPGALSVEETVFEAEGGTGEDGEARSGRSWVEDAATEEKAPFSSSTLAELYLRQGLVERAVEVYRQLLADEPLNERARTRLAEIGSAQPADGRTARRQALARTIAALEALLAAVQRRRA